MNERIKIRIRMRREGREKKINNRLIDCIKNLFDAERTFFYR